MSSHYPIPFDSDNPVDLFIAFDFIQNEILSGCKKTEACRRAAKQFQIPLSVDVLLKRYNRYEAAEGRLDKRQWFTLKDEVVFYLILESFALLDRPLSRRSFLDMVGKYVNEIQMVSKND